MLVRIHASGVNPLDIKIQEGKAAHARHPLPAILGLDLAGTVAAPGVGVTGVREGEAPYGMTGGVGGYQGSQAAFATVDATLLARKPTNLSMRAAAALPLIAITPWEGLVDRAHVTAGRTVLVQGGGGGVGHVVIQIARHFGASVFAAVRRYGHGVSCLGWRFSVRLPVSSRRASWCRGSIRDISGWRMRMRHIARSGTVPREARSLSTSPPAPEAPVKRLR